MSNFIQSIRSCFRSCFSKIKAGKGRAGGEFGNVSAKPVKSAARVFRYPYYSDDSDEFGKPRQRVAPKGSQQDRQIMTMDELSKFYRDRAKMEFRKAKACRYPNLAELGQETASERSSARLVGEQPIRREQSSSYMQPGAQPRSERPSAPIPVRPTAPQQPRSVGLIQMGQSSSLGDPPPSYAKVMANLGAYPSRSWEQPVA